MEKMMEVQRIAKQYVGDDCIQYMIPYKNTLTLLNQKGIIFHHGTNLYLNKYLQDERRKNFPYANIPIHYAQVGFQKYTYVNELLEFDTPYIRLGDGYIIENFVVKDCNQALLINKVLNGYQITKYLTYQELLNLVGKSSDNTKVYYFSLDGVMYPPDYPLFPKENITLVVKINKDNITIQGVKAIEVNDIFKVDVYDIPIAKFTFEELKYAPRIVDADEPKIAKRLNPGVTKKDIEEAKQMVRILKKPNQKR